VTATARVRRAGPWIAIGATLLVVGAVTAMIAGLSQLPLHGSLHPEAAAPEGGRALAQILRDRGVAVQAVDGPDAATAALAPGPATLVLGDTAALSDESLHTLLDRAADVVLIEPRARDLRIALDGAAPAGVGDGDAEPECALDDAVRAGAITPGTVFAPGIADTVACYPSGDGHGLLVRERGDGRVVALDGTAVLANQHLATGGNAALGLSLLGRHSLVVWYMPAIGDDAVAGSSLGELTPEWVTPALLVLLAAAGAAAVWRGRRFGPLVAENLPVTVRAGETTAGRARLYARAADPVHAADQLRVAALRRLARLLGLGPATPAGAIADAAATRTGADRRAVRDILFDTVPSTDRELVDLADHLRTLEDAVRRAARPERNRP